MFVQHHSKSRQLRVSGCHMDHLTTMPFTELKLTYAHMDLTFCQILLYSSSPSCGMLTVPSFLSVFVLATMKPSHFWLSPSRSRAGSRCKTHEQVQKATSVQQQQQLTHPQVSRIVGILSWNFSIVYTKQKIFALFFIANDPCSSARFSAAS